MANMCDRRGEICGRLGPIFIARASSPQGILGRVSAGCGDNRAFIFPKYGRWKHPTSVVPELELMFTQVQGYMCVRMVVVVGWGGDQ